MKLWAFLLAGIVIFAGCTTITKNTEFSNQPADNTKTVKQNQTQDKTTSQEIGQISNSPVVSFTEQEMETLGVSCSGTPEEIANCIYTWQKENMIYTPTTNIDFEFKPAYPIRWNEWFPGVFTSRDVIQTRTYEGRPYGVCWNFATVYCSIANHYGLQCRVVQTKSKISDGNTDLVARTGLNENEFAELEPYLKRAGKNYDYEAVRRVSIEGPAHYWAEVYLPYSSSEFKHGEWVVMDASNLLNNGRTETMKIIKNGDWEVVNWTAKDRTRLADEYQARINAGEDLAHENSENTTDAESFLEGREQYESDLENGRTSEYVGIVDDLGNSNRAETIDDFMQGKAFAPHISDCNEMCEFIRADSACVADCKDDQEVVECYESCSNEPFFLVCDYICEDETDSNSWVSCYNACSGTTINQDCILECYS